ncbi:hypothetical protein N7G274_009388 [Stereocaulon virgatum]|uniref:UBX domain-containing protein n=1 Tax=Stereocaulon virgatum TaxID=373712 RepID=A0ABR4A3K6_9LECA
MFFEGDLQSGIALALRDSKYVACFVKSDDEQSSTWENEYLKDEQINSALAAKAVTLRLNAGSQEAGYLAAYYPIPVVPAFIVIHNGQLILDLRAGKPKHEFKAALLKTMVNNFSSTAPKSSPNATVAQSSADPTLYQPSSSTSSTEPASSISASTTPQGTNASGPVAVMGPDTAASSEVHSPDVLLSAPSSNQPPQAPTTPQSQASLPNPSSHQPSQAIQNLLADRRRKLEIDKKEREAREKAERMAKAEARQAAISSDPNSAKAKQATYAVQQRKRLQEAKLEHERIVRQIEHDRAERKEKEELRKALAKENAEEKDNTAFTDKQLSKEINGPRSTRSKECAIQVRIFDGSTIRSKFPSESTLRSSVRTWIDSERRDGDVPYTFKQILTPLPNRSLSISDEEDSLLNLGLTPSATLVMVPVQDYTAAYAPQSLVSRGASFGYSVMSTGASLITGTLGTFLGLGQPTARGDEATTPTSPAQSGPKADSRGAGSIVNIRTLRDQRGNRDDHQFYNGNQLNFEPRRDVEDKED